MRFLETTTPYGISACQASPVKPARQYNQKPATTMVSETTNERRSSVRLNIGCPLKRSAAILSNQPPLRNGRSFTEGKACGRACPERSERACHELATAVQRHAGHQFRLMEIRRDGGGVSTNLRVAGFRVDEQRQPPRARQGRNLLQQLGGHRTLRVVRDNQRIEAPDRPVDAA